MIELGGSDELAGLIIFLTVFLSLYGGLNLYGFLKAKRALSLSFGASLPLLIFMIIMVLVPILVRLSERQGLETVAKLLAFVGYFWMGLLFFFFSTYIT